MNDRNKLQHDSLDNGINIPIRILLIADDHGDGGIVYTLLMQMVQTVPFVITTLQQIDVALNQLNQPSYDLVLLDFSLPACEGIQTFKQIHTQAPDLPIIILSSFEDTASAIEAVRQGAQDYLVKGQIDSRLLVRSIRYAIERQRLRLTPQTEHWQHQQERELSLLEQLTNYQATVIASKLYCNLPLEETVTEEFQRLVEHYRQLLELAMEQRQYRVTHDIDEQMRGIAEQLGFLKASPRDVIALHTIAIKPRMAQMSSVKAEIYMEEARIMVLQLMGYLASYYRKFHLAVSPLSNHSVKVDQTGTPESNVDRLSK